MKFIVLEKQKSKKAISLNLKMVFEGSSKHKIMKNDKKYIGILVPYLLCDEIRLDSIIYILLKFL